MKREDAELIEIDGDLSEIVEQLIQLRECGKNVSAEFNGIMLYSCDVTMDKAFLEVLGITKSQEELMERTIGYQGNGYGISTYYSVLAQRQKKELTTGITIDDLIEKSKKWEILKRVELTGSRLALDDLSRVLPENEYQELLQELKRRCPSELNNPLENEVSTMFGNIQFVISEDSEYGYRIEECNSRGNEGISRSISLEEIDGVQLAESIANVMRKHLDSKEVYGSYNYYHHDMPTILNEDIRWLDSVAEYFREKRDKALFTSAIEATIPVVNTTSVEIASSCDVNRDLLEVGEVV